MAKTATPTKGNQTEGAKAPSEATLENRSTLSADISTSNAPVAELDTPTGRGPLLQNAIADAMAQGLKQERNTDQRQEQQLYASVWGNFGPVLLKVIPTPAVDYRRQAEQLQNQIDLLIEAKKKEKKRFDARDPRVFNQLQALLGEQAAQDLVKAIDGAVAKHGAALQNNPKAVAELLTEISQALSSGGMLAKLGVSPQAVEAAVQSSTLVPAVNPIADLSKFDSDIPVKEASAAASFIEGQYLADTLRKNTADQFTSVQGIEYLTQAILEQKSEAGRLNTLKNIKNALGEERFEQFLDMYSQLKGEALMTTLLSREGQTEAQKKQIISAYLTSERALMPSSELARVKHGLLSKYGFARSAVQREQQAVKDMISQAEAEKAKALGHLEDVLELEGLKKLPEAQAIEKIRTALKARYPKLKTSADLSDIVTQLRDVVSSQGPITQHELKAIGWKGDSLSNDESEEIKQDLLRICDNLLTIERKNEELKAYQLVAREGHAGEAEFVDADFEIYKTTLGLSDQEMSLYVERAELYRAGLDQRIKTASAKDREALCQERDQLDWRSMSARIEHHLRQDPPNLERAHALLAVYQISAGTSGAERTAEYRIAAESVGKTINAIEEYNKKLKVCIDTEDAEVQKYLDHLKDRFNDDKSLLYKRQKALDALYWYNDKTEATRLVKWAQRQLGLSTERYNASQQSGVPYNNRLGDHGRAIDQTRSAALQGILSPMQALPTAFRRDTIEGIFDRPEVLRESPADGGPDWSINDNEALKDLITSAQALEDLFSSTSKVTSDLESRRPIELPAVNLETPESREALHKLYQIDTVDPTMEPSDAALEALRECVAGSDNEAFAVLNERGTNRDRLNQLYPRLSPEDSLRVKAFLLSYDDPSMFSHFGDVPEMQTPKDVWNFLQTVSENETAQELSGFMDLLPNLHRLRKTTALLDSLGAEDRAALDVSYSQLTSRGVGEYLIDNAPLGEARIAYLRELVSTESLTGEQLSSLFPEGRVPEGIKERTQLFGQLCLKDRESATGDFERFEAYLKAHVQEEGELRGALPTLIQMQRTEAALEVTRRLEELEADYQREFKSCFEGISEEELNRRGIRSAYAATRTGLVGFAQQHAMNPNGEMSQKAFQFLKMMEREDTPFEVVEDSIRTLGFSESQMRVFEAHYSRHVATRQNGRLTGNFAVDIAARNDTSQDVSNLIQGGEALTAYDLEQLSEGMRTQNATLTLRAMVAIKAREGAAGLRDRIAELDLPEKWKQVKESKEAKLVAEYIDAAVHNDTVRMGVVELANMARNGVHWAGEGTERALHTIGSWSSDRRDDAAVLYRQLTGEDFGVSLEKFGTFRREIWNDIVSSEPAKRTGAALAIAGEAIKDGVLNLDLLNFSLSIDGVDLQQIKSFLDEKAGKMKDALMYTGGKPPTIVEYIRLRGGEMAHAEASLLEKLFEPTADIEKSRALLERFVMTRDRLLFQMEQADRLHAQRSKVLAGSQEFFVNIVNISNRSASDAASRYTGRTLAKNVRDIDKVMYHDQQNLLQGHHRAMGDIESTREIMRVRSVALLTDLVENRDRGLSADSNDRDFRDLRIRDSKHEWVVARREVVEKWQRDSELARKKLADHDWWVDTSVTVLKTVAVIGVAFIPGIGFWGALALATALNLAEKAYFVYGKGMDFETAAMKFGFELMVDAALLGFGRVLKLSRAVGQGAAKTGEATKVLGRSPWRLVFKEPQQIMPWVDDIGKVADDVAGLASKSQRIAGQRALEHMIREGAQEAGIKGVQQLTAAEARASLAIGNQTLKNVWLGGESLVTSLLTPPLTPPLQNAAQNFPEPEPETLPTNSGRPVSPTDSLILDADNPLSKPTKEPSITQPTLTPQQIDEINGLITQGTDLLANFDGLLSGAWERLFGSTGDPGFIPPPPPTPPAGGAPGGATPPGTGTGGNGGTGDGTPPPIGPALEVPGNATAGNSYTNAPGQQTAASSGGDSGGAISGSSEPTSLENNIPAEALQAFDQLQQIFNSVSDTVQNFPENFSPVYDEIQTTLSEGVAALQDFYNGALALQEQGKQSDPLAQTAADLAATQIANANPETNSNADSNASADSTANADTNQVPQANEQADAEAQAFVLVQRTAERLSTVNASANELLNKVSQNENHQVAQDQANAQVEQVAQQDGTFMHVRRAEAAAAAMRARVVSKQEEMIERDVALRDKNAVKAKGEADKEMQADANVSSEKTATADQELVTKDIRGAKETTTSSAMRNSADAEREEYIDSHVAKQAQVHEAEQVAQMKTQSEQVIRERQSQDAEVLMQSKEQASRRHAQNEEKLLAQVEEARSQQVAQREKQLTEALANSTGVGSAPRGGLGGDGGSFEANPGSDGGDGGDGSEGVKVNAKNKAQHSVLNKETKHATGDTASEAKQEAISTIMAKAGVARSESAESQTIEGVVGEAGISTSETSISKNMEKLIATLSDQVGDQVKEAASFLAGLDEAPKMMTADRSSQTLLDGSTIDVASAISEVGDAMDLPRMKSADAKRRAIKKTKRRREIEVLIQVLLTRQMESSKREKLLRMLLALGISEIEYRALVSKLGELEVAAQAMAAEAEKASQKERQAMMVEPLLREPEAPKIKSDASDSAEPPKMKSVSSTTRGAMYERLLKQKEKSSSEG